MLTRTDLGHEAALTHAPKQPPTRGECQRRCTAYQAQLVFVLSIHTALNR
jgi:hypothetical protein